MKFAVCECGARIKVVTDLHEMTRTINAHAAMHEKLETNPKKSEEERLRIETQLARKVIMSIIDMNSDISMTIDITV